MITDRPSLKDMGEAGRACAARYFEPRAVTSEILRHYMAIVESYKARVN
jgi:hypothetical protein